MAKGEETTYLLSMPFMYLKFIFQAYTFDPLANLTASEIPLVLGGTYV